MKTTIITVSYDHDLEYLKYCLKSIKKFCKGYYGNVVVIDNHKNDCIKTQQYLEDIGQKYFVDTQAQYVKKGYIRQQYIKLKADLYVPEETEHILHIDSDSMFTQEHSPDVFFENNRPVLLKDTYTAILARLRRAGQNTKGVERWQVVTSGLTGLDVTHEYMRLMPLVYPTDVHKKIRKYLEDFHGRSLLDIFRNAESASEYNILGAFSDAFHQNEFRIIDRTSELKNFQNYRVKTRELFRQFSSRQPRHNYVCLQDPNNQMAKLLA